LLGEPSLKRKIGSGFAALIVPILVTGGLSAWEITSSVDRFEAASREQVEESLAMTELRDELITAEWWTMQYVNEGQRSAKKKFLDIAVKIDANVAGLTVLDTVDEQRIARKIRDAWVAAEPVAMRAIAKGPGSSETTRFYPLEEFHPPMENAIGLLVDLNEETLDELALEVGGITGRRDWVLLTLALIFGSTVIVSIGVARKIRKRVQTSLDDLETGAGRFAQHDFTHRVDRPREREFVPIATALNEMAERVSSAHAARAELEDELRHQALHDSLTTLANRVLLTERVNAAIAGAREAARTTGILFLDVDEFKSVNDTFGHETGDALLVAIGDRLTKCIRASDTAARIGGDEFAVLLCGMAAPADAALMADRILEAFDFPFFVGELELEVHPSIGYASSHDHTVTGQELLRRADVAMYEAKRGGKNKSLEYSRRMDEAVQERAHLNAQLRHAIEGGELVALFQPIVDLSSGSIQGAEALMRWDHPTDGRLTPDRFLPGAEESGYIYELDKWMLEHACRQAVEWHRDGLRDLTISVNLSSRTLQRENLVAEVGRVLRETGLAPRYLILEITENAYLDSAAAARLSELKALGVSIAIDDFGTGYCSLNYLRRFPIDILKIDKTFVDPVGQDPEQTALARAIVSLAGALSLRTVAEGIEGNDQITALTSFGVDFGQGYVFAKPVDDDSLRALVRNGANGSALGSSREAVELG
jgi:diguanylate cyclase (GGDEF)-like protein